MRMATFWNCKSIMNALHKHRKINERMKWKFTKNEKGKA